MPVYKDIERNTFYVKTYYTDYTGTKKQKFKRGFKLQREAKEWETEFLAKQAAQPSMPYKTLAELYLEDKKSGKEGSYITEKYYFDKWIIPYFNNKAINMITPADVREWQTYLKNAKGRYNKPLSPGYMNNLVKALSMSMNYAVRFYGLASNPCKVAGNKIGKKSRSMTFWTNDEFDKFIGTFDIMDEYYTIFMVLYYTGMRIGELQALTIADIDLSAGTININKTYHNFNGREVVTEPKTEKSNRTITIPPFLCQIIEKHIKRIYDAQPNDNPFRKKHRLSYTNALKTHAEMAGIKPIRVHDLRHSHASLLIELGFSAILVSERLGHEDVSTTLNIYAHLFPSKQSEIAAKLQSLYQTAK